MSVLVRPFTFSLFPSEYWFIYFIDYQLSATDDSNTEKLDIVQIKLNVIAQNLNVLIFPNRRFIGDKDILVKME